MRLKHIFGTKTLLFLLSGTPFFLFCNTICFTKVAKIKNFQHIIFVNSQGTIFLSRLGQSTMTRLIRIFIDVENYPKISNKKVYAKTSVYLIKDKNLGN